MIMWDIIVKLHWFPVCERIGFKIMLLTYNRTKLPKYNSNVCYKASRPLQ